MSSRITSVDQLGGMSAWARKQLERQLHNLPANPAVCAPNAGAAAVKLSPGSITPVKKTVHRPEEDAGRMLVEWIDLVVLRNGLRPGLFFFHVPNGLARTAAQGGIFKAQGLRKGWPDYGLDLPLGRYHGLRLELKAPNGDKPTREQLDILARLESVGFKCVVAWGFDEAKKAISGYLDLAI